MEGFAGKNGAVSIALFNVTLTIKIPFLSLIHIISSLTMEEEKVKFLMQDMFGIPLIKGLSCKECSGA